MLQHVTYCKIGRRNEKFIHKCTVNRTRVDWPILHCSSLAKIRLARSLLHERIRAPKIVLYHKFRSPAGFDYCIKIAVISSEWKESKKLAQDTSISRKAHEKIVHVILSFVSRCHGVPPCGRSQNYVIICSSRSQIFF